MTRTAKYAKIFRIHARYCTFVSHSSYAQDDGRHLMKRVDKETIDYLMRLAVQARYDFS